MYYSIGQANSKSPEVTSFEDPEDIGQKPIEQKRRKLKVEEVVVFMMFSSLALFIIGSMKHK